MNMKRFLRNNMVVILIVAVVGVFLYNYGTSEGFKAGDILNQNDCMSRGTTANGSYTWKNGKCYAPCGQGLKMRGKADKCGPLDDRFTQHKTTYPKNSKEYKRFYKPSLFTDRPLARY